MKWRAVAVVDVFKIEVVFVRGRAGKGIGIGAASSAPGGVGIMLPHPTIKLPDGSDR
jgi:hypothetical protein